MTQEKRELKFDPPVENPPKDVIIRRRKAIKRILNMDPSELGGPFPPGTSVRLIREGRRQAQEKYERRGK